MHVIHVIMLAASIFVCHNHKLFLEECHLVFFDILNCKWKHLHCVPKQNIQDIERYKDYDSGNWMYYLSSKVCFSVSI